MRDTTHFEVAIVGTGFSGLGTAIQLLKKGRRSFVLFEKASEVGGCWRENHYPGCQCDVPSHLYSFSFAPNPNWSRMFAPQAEIQAYLDRCARDFGVLPHVRFRSEVKGADFDEATGLWHVHVKGPDGVQTFTARHLVLGVGALSRPKIPSLPGIERFQGPAFHSAEWRDDFVFEGKRIAVIGTGASAIQFVPQIVDKVSKLHVFQRTAPWILPHPDREMTDFERRLFERLPLSQRLYRYAIYWQSEARALGFTVEPRILNLAKWLGERNIRRQIQDPELRAKVRPTITPGCKRLLMSNTYYSALARPNAELVTTGVAEVTENAIVDKEGRAREVDAIVYGTGFDVANMLAPMRVVGRGGRELNEEWRRGGVEAYLGTTVSGFPNLYTLMGPNTGLGHNSMVFMIEAQIAYALREMEALEQRGARWADVRPAAQRAFNDELQPRLAKTVWATGCQSWYLDENGRNITLWPGFTVEFWMRSLRFRPGDHVFGA